MRNPRLNCFTTDEILDGIRKIRSNMACKHDLDMAAKLGAMLVELVEELDERLSFGEELPQAWRQGR